MVTFNTTLRSPLESTMTVFCHIKRQLVAVVLQESLLEAAFTGNNIMVDMWKQLLNKLWKEGVSCMHCTKYSMDL